MKTGAGITIYDAGTEERNVVGGGTVNAVQYGKESTLYRNSQLQERWLLPE